MSLLIEALKQAEARKGPKAGKPASGAAASENPDPETASTDAAAATASAEPAGTSPATGEGLSLSLAPREDAPRPGATDPVATAAPEPAAAAPTAAMSAPPPTTSAPPAEPAASPKPEPSPSAPSPAAASTVSARADAARPAERPRLQTGSEAAQRTARDVLAAAHARPAPPTRRWRILLGVLMLMALGMAGGLWWLSQQTQSGLAPGLASVPPVSDAIRAEAEQDLSASSQGASPLAQDDPAAPPATVVEAGQAGAPATDAPSPAAPSMDRTAVAAEATLPADGTSPAPRPAPPPLVSAPPATLGPTPQLRIERARQAQQPMIDAYAALNRGELSAARRDYQRALQLHPDHPDALLGLAVIAEREGDLDSAARRYREVLRVDPRNPTALAALLGSGQSIGAGRSESQLREALAAQPRAAALHLALGNLLAANQRWAEAQQAYFDAAVLAPDDPDVVFNLAVALDRLHKPALALDHYLRAESLRRARPANFDPRAAAQRITALSRQLGRGGDAVP